jgi:predicted metalloprotease with PDZ domain
MEHRNSTVMTSSSSIAGDRVRLLETVSHEFFHCWNVERIRPRDIEPFDLDRVNMTGELWLAEGFTQYYGPLAMERAGLMDTAAVARGMTGLIESVAESPGHLVRSAEEMSRMAPFIDGGNANDRTNWSNTVISYYPFGGAIALALDLSLRDRSEGKVSLDDFMRAMWRVHGKPGGAHEGYVDHSYTMADAEARLAEVSGSRQFARDFFARYIQGHDVADYGRLLDRAGFTLRKRNAGAAWWGDVRVGSQGSAARIGALVPANSPAYAAGLEQNDELQQIDGQKISAAADVQAIIARHKPGDRIDVVYVDRMGKPKTAAVTLAEDPHQEVVPVETSGGTLTPQQQAFRAAWLGPK